MRVERAKDTEERERRLGMRLFEQIVSAGIMPNLRAACNV
jgi:hypothetical protein